MSRKRYSAEEIVNKLWQAAVELGKGKLITEVCNHLGISEPARCDRACPPRSTAG
jgi:hypothetical protein